MRASMAGKGSRPHRVRRLPAGRLCTGWVKQGHPDHSGWFPLESVSGARHKAPRGWAESNFPARRGREAAARGVGTLTAESPAPAIPLRWRAGAGRRGGVIAGRLPLQTPPCHVIAGKWRPAAAASAAVCSPATPRARGLERAGGPDPRTAAPVSPPPTPGSMDLTSQPCSLKDDSINLKVIDHSGAQIDEIDNLKEELEKWKERLEKAEKQKDELLLLKLSADGKRDQTQDELRKLMDLEEEQCKESMIKKENQERNLTVVKQQNIELRREIQKLKDDLAAKSSKLSQDFRIKREIPKKKMKFTRMENAESDDTFLNTCCLFHIAAKIPFRLQQRQALLTFEEEDVAQKLIRREKHTVSLDNEKIELKAMPVTLETGVKFELHVTISGEKINVSEVPHLPIPDEWIRDKIELNFYKSKQGGGEVKDVRYDRRSRTAIITFLKPGDIFWDFQEDHTVVRNPRG
nr:N-myc-interactor isoform X2 [Chrysemys picta bellii]